MPTFQQLPFSIPFSVNKLASTTGNNKTQLRSPLEAAAQGDLTRLQQLWDQDFDFDLQSTPDGLRPLHYAASRGHLSIVKFLIDCCHVTVDIVDHEGETALLKAAYAGHFSVVEYLIIHAGANVLHEDKDGWSALHNACSYGDLDMVIFLIDHFLNVNLQSKMDHTPLTSKGHLRIVQHLVYKANADLFIKNKFGETAYDAAAVAGEVYICEQLEKAERERIQDGYDLLRQHYTIPVILYENQQSVISLMTNSYIPSTWEKHQRIPWMLASSSSFLGDDDNNNQYMTKNQVRLPPLTDQQVWMWLTDWKIDYTHPNVDMDGWQYATHLDTPDENWSNKLPKSSTRRISYVRRRRWVRIMTRQRSSDIHDNNINDSDIETNHHPTTTTIIDLDATDDNSNAQE
ncbi:ankyrin repeat-containing domain protein [Halteromyces radiatus]|uniref:ankyrin repeat-containing domain protein n=1 Tax=Halteromyces radiatus TaxID=101107 RepID=UPI00221F32F4|nr:ankyrin repeat-containing domain protein [Halteromyces radiatus]KAI8089892.1 ankyrin repeat-containing domain protein [Halteromyces radiatus]